MTDKDIDLDWELTRGLPVTITMFILSIDSQSRATVHFHGLELCNVSWWYQENLKRKTIFSMNEINTWKYIYL